MSTTGELHVVFGSGPVGLAVVETLLAQGKQVRVVSRSGARRSLPDSVEVVRGDATHPGHPPGVFGSEPRLQLHQRARLSPLAAQFPPLQRGVLAGAVAAGAKLVVMENLYADCPHHESRFASTQTV